MAEPGQDPDSCLPAQGSAFATDSPTGSAPCTSTLIFSLQPALPHPDLPPHTQGSSHLSCLCSPCCKARTCTLQEAHPGYPTKPIHTSHPPPNHPPIYVRTQRLGPSSLTVVSILSYLARQDVRSSIFFLLILLLLVQPQLQTQLPRVTKYGEKRVTSEVR